MAISYRRSTYIPTTSQQLHVTIMRVEKLSCSLVYSRPHPLPTRQDRCAAHTARDRICTAAARRAGQSSMEETTARRSMDGAGAQACRGSEARRGEARDHQSTTRGACTNGISSLCLVCDRLLLHVRPGRPGCVTGTLRADAVIVIMAGETSLLPL